MKDICSALYEYLSQDREVSAIVKTRIYPMLMPQEASLPSIVYTPTSAKYDSALCGDTGYVKQNLQINCHDSTFKKARELSRLIKKKLQDFHGNMRGINIEAVFIESDFMLDGNTTANFSTEKYTAVLEFEISFNEERDAPKK